MKKKILSLTVALIMLLTLAMPMNAAYAVDGVYTTEGAYTYLPYGSQAVITSYDAGLGGTTPVIPDKLGGCNVTIISQNAFSNKGLTSVVLPDTLVEIGDNAFLGNNIESLIIPNNVKSIGISAFEGTSISSITLGSSLELIGYRAFYHNRLNTVVIPASIGNISLDAFSLNGDTGNSGNIVGKTLAGTWNVVDTTWVKYLLSQEPPTSVGTAIPTLKDMSDGKLTGTTALMEYLPEDDYNNHSEFWKTATEGDTEVHPGVYMIRYAATGTKAASDVVKKVVGFTSPFSGGTGEISTPYEIETAEQLDSVRYFILDPITETPNNFILTKDIDLGVAPYNTGEYWEPIEALVGQFDGRGHVIKNMTILESEDFGAGLFKIIYMGKVINLGITDAKVEGTEAVGILAGMVSENSHVEKVYVTGSVKGDSYIGGISGVFGTSPKTLKSCYVLADVTGNDVVGGLVGMLVNSRIANSYFVGNVVVGDAKIIDKGGIVGKDYVEMHDIMPMSNIYLSNYYYNITDTAGFNGIGGTSKSAVEMKNKATYLAGTGEEIWDFDTVWQISPSVNNGYPTLRFSNDTPPVTPPSTPSGGSSRGGTAPATDTSSVTVNGQKENAGRETTQTVNGLKQVKLDVDEGILAKKIEAVLKEKTDSSQNVVSLAVGSGDNATVQLTGDIVKKMEKEDFNLSIKKDKVEYTIPASEITIDKVSDILGVAAKDLKDIDVEVKINKVSDEVLAKYNKVAEQFKNEFVVAPVEFEIVAKTTGTDGKVRETSVSKFSNYVERILEIPANVDASKITTGIVFNADGTYSHVPTEVFQKDGKWYAKINSLTNSTYSVIYNPITVDSVKGHWSEETVNDMASRLVLIDYKNFDANEAVTRAEFADYIVRALGLYREDVAFKTTFKDVTADSKNNKSIQIASDWGIISGYADGTFKATKTITRQESMAMYARAMEVAKIAENKANKLAVYKDSSEVAKWAIPSVQRVVNAGIFNGKGNGLLAPKGTLTQAEALTAVRNLLVKAELINK